jgi:hypothetical protein
VLSFISVSGPLPNVFHGAVDPPQLLVKLWHFFSAVLRAAFPGVKQRANQRHHRNGLRCAKALTLRHQA